MSRASERLLREGEGVHTNKSLHTHPSFTPRQSTEYGPMDAKSLRLALLALLYYSCIFLVKTSMFACSFANYPTLLGLSYKTCLALAQTFGYAMGKVPSLMFSPKLLRSQLRGALVAVIVSAGSLITLSCATPPAASLLLITLACVCLAPTWSILQRFLEGRRDTEAIVAVVSFSYIGSSGLCKGIAVDLTNVHGLSDGEAVAACATVGVCVGVAAAIGVASQPPPSAADVAKRGRRKAMVSYRDELGQLIRGGFGPGIALIVGAYTLLGALRAYRDYFQVELFSAVDLRQSTSLFAKSEFTVSLLVLASSAGFGRFEDNSRALRWILRVAAPCALGIALMTTVHESGALGGLSWMIGVGACTFLGYVPLGTMAFDRLLGAARYESTSALLNLLMDASVLLGTASILIYKDFFVEDPRAVRAHAGHSDEEDAREAQQIHAFFCAACWRVGLSVAALALLAEASLVRAIDRRQRLLRKVDSGEAL